jgi:hypothetical protein
VTRATHDQQRWGLDEREVVASQIWPAAARDDRGDAALDLDSSDKGFSTKYRASRSIVDV